MEYLKYNITITKEISSTERICTGTPVIYYWLSSLSKYCLHCWPLWCALVYFTLVLAWGLRNVSIKLPKVNKIFFSLESNKANNSTFAIYLTYSIHQIQ